MINHQRHKLLKTIPGWEGAIARRFPSGKKLAILEWAKNKSNKRPHAKTHPLGSAFAGYINSGANGYDAEFTREIKELRPDWFETKSVLATRKKLQLLSLAQDKTQPKPNYDKHPLGKELSSYTLECTQVYDAEFTRKIKELRPDWFERSTDRTKEQLLLLAKDKTEPRPRNRQLARSLSRYTTKNSTDKKFNEKIRKLRPDWFVTQSDRANLKKKQLLKLARDKNQPRPALLSRYTGGSRKTYDVIFSEQIRRLRPDWFVTRSDKAGEKKDQLLAIARSNDPKPTIRNHPLGKVLLHYTNLKSPIYDGKFTKLIKKIRPEWLMNPSDKATHKKDQLLIIARQNSLKPVIGKHPLGKVLSHYTSSKSKTYDAIFTKELRKIAPHWFGK